MRRRSSDELMETQLLQEFGIAGGGRPLPPGRPAEPHSPETRVALDLLYASMDDNTNRCASLSEEDLFFDRLRKSTSTGAPVAKGHDICNVELHKEMSLNRPTTTLLGQLCKGKLPYEA